MIERGFLSVRRSWPLMVAYLLVSVLFVVNYLQLVSFAVDIPTMDEWEAVRVGAVSRDLDWAWIFRPHNEHRIVFTKLQIWILYVLGNWNLVANLVTSFGIFLGLCFVCIRYASRLAETNLVLLAIPFVSVLNWENLVTPFQSQFHLFLAFFLMALWARVEGRSPWRVSGLLWIWCSAYAFGAGIFCALAYAGLNVLMMILFKDERRRSLLHAVVALAIVGAWAIGYQKVPWHKPYTWPDDLAFWDFFANIVAFGFGYRNVTAVPGAIILGILFGGMIWLARRARRETLTQPVTGQTFTPGWQQFVIALTWASGILLALVSITLGRTGIGIAASKTPRYFEVGMLLMPLVAMLLLVIARHYLGVRNRRAAIAAGCIVTGLLLPFGYHLKVAGKYRGISQERVEGERCVRRYYAAPTASPVLCPTIYPSDLKEYLDNAKLLGVGFARRLSP